MLIILREIKKVFVGNISRRVPIVQIKIHPERGVSAGMRHRFRPKRRKKKHAHKNRRRKL